MPLASPLPVPAWLKNMPDGPLKQRAQRRFYIRLAAIFASESGSLSSLSQLCGKDPKYFYNMVYGWMRNPDGDAAIPPILAKAIERAAGTELVTKELLAPEVFED
jgi:hypothetical protein